MKWSRADDLEVKAKEKLIFYFRQLYEKSGLQWDTDNRVEIIEIVECIIEAAVMKAKEDHQR